MTPMSATIIFIIISVIILFVKHIFTNQALSDQYNFLKLNLLYRIPADYQTQPQQSFNSLYQSYMQTPINTKKVTIIQGNYQYQPLHTAAQNDLRLVSCGQHYTLFMETGIKKGFWVSRIGLYTLPYMKQLQVMSIPGKLQMQMNMQCKPFYQNQGYQRSTGYTLTYAIQQSSGWAIYTLKIVTSSVQPIYPRHFYSQLILAAIPSKPLAVSISEKRNLYVYTTEDTPWILEIESMQYQIPYKRSSSKIDIVNNGARIYSHFGSYKATTFGKYKQKWNSSQQRSEKHTDFEFVSKYKRTGIIIPYEIVISKSGNRVTYVYQHKNHPYCIFNVLMRATWDISAMNRQTRCENILSTNNLDLYLKSGPQYYYGHNNDPYFNYIFSGKTKTQHENTGADIIGTVYEQTSDFIVDCETIQSRKSLYAESESILCVYLIKGNHYLNLVRLGNEVFPLPTETINNANNSNRQQFRESEKSIFSTLNFFNRQIIKQAFGKEPKKNEEQTINKSSNQDQNSTQSNEIQGSAIPKVMFDEQHITDMPRKNKSVSMQHIYFSLPKQTNALNFKNIKILTLNATSTKPIIFLQTNHFSDQSYIFTCQLNGTKNVPHKFFDLKGRFDNYLKHFIQRDFEFAFQRRVDLRIVEANYIDEKIVLMWGFGIQIYQLEDQRIQRQKFEGVPMDYFLPLVELFAMVFCMFKILISTNS